MFDKRGTDKRRSAYPRIADLIVLRYEGLEKGMDTTAGLHRQFALGPGMASLPGAALGRFLEASGPTEQANH